MLLILQKFIGGLLLPLSFLLIMMGLSLLLIWFSHWQKTAKILLTLSWLNLFLLSLQPVADHLLAPLENQYPTYQGSEPIDYIVVLGGGYTYNPLWAPSSNLMYNSLPRVAEGVRLYLKKPGAKLIFTGGKALGNPRSSASVAAEVAESLGVPASDIILADKPKNTEQEAQEIAKIVGDHPLLLVTSANHLPRAIQFFQQQGLKPIPAPANQLAITSPLNPWEKVLPNAYYLSHSERACYETLASWWLKIKGPDHAEKSMQN